ncbi:MAG: hypothetical protein ACFFDN_05290 [Candidatus Hodarchaeota archaeon]
MKDNRKPIMVDPKVRAIIKGLIGKRFRGVKLDSIKKVVEVAIEQFEDHPELKSENYNICDMILYMQQLFPELNLTDEIVENHVKEICSVDSVPEDFELTEKQLNQLIERLKAR